jgi:hypothetical protein
MNYKDFGSGSRSAAAGICLVGLVISGCDDGARKETTPRQTSSTVKPHQTVSMTEHQIFEKKYAEKCIKSQQGSADSQLSSDQELGEVCNCMAKEISGRLSKADAVHFNEKNEFPFDLVMMTNAAANHCLPQK